MARWYSDTTQIAWVCKQLVDGEKISHACEFMAVQGWRLAAIIHNLATKYEWPIDHEDAKHGIRFYFLKMGTDKAKLKKPKSYKDYLAKEAILQKEKGAVTPNSK